jgi:hypothetical protein
VNIDVSRDSGATWSSLAAAIPSSGAANGTFSWVVTGPPSTTARIRVSWTADPAVSDVGAVDFEIR